MEPQQELRRSSVPALLQPDQVVQCQCQSGSAGMDSIKKASGIGLFLIYTLRVILAKEFLENLKVNITSIK